MATPKLDDESESESEYEIEYTGSDGKIQTVNARRASTEQMLQGQLVPVKKVKAVFKEGQHRMPSNSVGSSSRSSDEEEDEVDWSLLKWKLDDKIEIVGLAAAPQYNGKRGIVSDYDGE